MLKLYSINADGNAQFCLTTGARRDISSPIVDRTGALPPYVSSADTGPLDPAGLIRSSVSKQSFTEDTLAVAPALDSAKDPGKRR